MAVIPQIPTNIRVHLGSPDSDSPTVTIPFADFVDELSDLGRGRGLDIHTMHEDIFNTMHHI